MDRNKTDVAVLILAAGSSSRLGQPKQLLTFQNTTLLEHSIEVALSITEGCSVILGSNYAEIKSQIENIPTNILYHQEWTKGMGSSISFGLKEQLKKQPNLQSIMILLCDQPFVSSELLDVICESHFNGAQTITACSYGKAFGVPAIFDKKHFSELMDLDGHKGAKKIISDNIDLTAFIDFPKGGIDIDERADLKYLK